jgi:hypothetical protein
MAVMVWFRSTSDDHYYIYTTAVKRQLDIYEPVSHVVAELNI